MYATATTTTMLLAALQFLWPGALASPPNILNLIVDDLRVPVPNSGEDLLLPNLNELRVPNESATALLEAYTPLDSMGRRLRDPARTGGGGQMLSSGPPPGRRMTTPSCACPPGCT